VPVGEARRQLRLPGIDDLDSGLDSRGVFFDIFGKNADQDWGVTDESTLLMQESLRAFVREALSVFVPQSIHWGFHIDAVCDHLQAISEGQIQNLIINMPPRCLKSSIVAVCWLPWEWIKNPKLRYMFTSYDLNLSMRDSVYTRNILKSDWYLRRWGHIFRVTKDVDAKKLFENTQGGRRLATSVGSGNTGEGGERIVADDAHNVLKAESDTDRERVINWWKIVMSTRINRADAAKVIIGQRVHHNDLTGHVVESMGQGGERYERLILPMEYDPRLVIPAADLRPDEWREYEVSDGEEDPPQLQMMAVPREDRAGRVIPEATSLGFCDPRDGPGDLLIPDQWPQRSVDQWKFELGPYQYSAQFQQAPSPAEGGRFKEHWWRRYDLINLWHQGLRPEIIVVDSSYGTEDGDFTGVSAWGTMGGRLYVIDARLWREEIPDLRRNLRDLHARYRVPFLIENKANGMTLIQDLRRGFEEAKLPSLPVIEFTPDGMDKTQRAYSVINYVAGGIVYLPEGAPWVDEWILQHKQFPKGAHDDLVDTTAMAVTWLAKHTAEIRSLLLQPLPAPLIASSYQPGEVYHGGYYTR